MSFRDYHKSTKARSKTDAVEPLTLQEQILWERLKDAKLGFNFKRHVQVLEYDLDFFCPETQLNVELEGGKDSKTRSRVSRRTDRLGECGIETVRIPLLVFEPDQTELFNEWIQKVEDICWERLSR